MERPEEVPAAATFDEKDGLWRDGDAGTPLERLWADGGRRMLEAPRENGKLHGDVRWSPAISDPAQLESRVAIARSLGLPVGPTPGVIATFEHGVLRKAVFTHGVFDDMDGWFKPVLVAELDRGKLTKLVWKVGATGGEPLFSLGDVRIEPGQFQIPKPRPHELVVTFANGRPLGHAFHDERGQPVAGPGPLEAWGDEATRQSLVGYVERGEFARDAKKFFPKAAKVQVEGLPKKTAKIAKLPAAVALETAVRKKQLPWMGTVLDLSSFGGDCEAMQLDGASDPKYVAIACNGSGDYYLLDTTTGAVHVYRHDEGKLDPTAFASLDEAMWALLRIEAATQGRIPKLALEKTLQALGLDAGVSILRE